MKLAAVGAAAALAFVALRWTLVAPAPTVAPVHNERDASQPPSSRTTLAAPEAARLAPLDASDLDASDASRASRSFEAERDGATDGRANGARPARDGGRRRPSGNYEIF